MKDPILDSLQDTIDKAGFRIIRYTPPGVEFPDGSVAARITGPGMPLDGLPFCVPEKDKDIWARRICLVLTNTFNYGKGTNNAPPPRPH